MPTDLTPTSGIELNCIKARGIQLRKNYLAENINYSDTLTTTLEIIFTGNNEDLTAWKNHIDTLSTNAVGEWSAAGLTIYGLNFVNCRIVSANFPTSSGGLENAIHAGTATIVIEERNTGDLTNMLGEPNYQTIQQELSASGNLIDDMSEDIELTINKGEQYGFTHSISLRLTDLNVNRLAAAQSIAQAILNPPAPAGVPAFGFAFNAGAYATFSPSVTPYFTESINLETGDYSLTKTYKTYTDIQWIDPVTGLASSGGPNANYSFELTHSFVQDNSGIVNITENGKVKGKHVAPMGGIGWSEAGRFKYAKDGVADLLTDSYSRCNDFYAHGLWPNQSVGVASPIGKAVDPDTGAGSGPLNLRPEPISITRNLDGITQECSYSITYTDDPSQSWTSARNLRRDSTISSAQDSTGNVIISENVTIINAGDRDQVVDIFSALNEDHGLQESEYPPNNSGCPSGGPSACLTTPGPVLGVVDFPATFGGISDWNLLSGSRARVEHYYQNIIMPLDTDFPDFSFKLISLSYEFPVGNKTGSYTTEFTSDPDIFEPAVRGIKRMNVETSDNFRNKQYQTYPIPQWKVLVHDPDQTSMSSRTVTANLTLERVPGINRLSNAFPFAGAGGPSIPSDSLGYAATEVRTKLMNVYVDEGLTPLIYPQTRIAASDPAAPPLPGAVGPIYNVGPGGGYLTLQFISNCEYSFDSKGSATLSAQMDYVQKL